MGEMGGNWGLIKLGGKIVPAVDMMNFSTRICLFNIKAENICLQDRPALTNVGNVNSRFFVLFVQREGWRTETNFVGESL